MEFKLISNDITESLYNKTQEKIMEIVSRIYYKPKYRFPELYSYQVVDNFRMDNVLEGVNIDAIKPKKPVEMKNRLITLRNFNITDNYFPLYALGYMTDGKRRTRASINKDYADMLVETIEVRLSGLIPGIIYQLDNKYYDEEEFYTQYTSYEKKDFLELLQCLLTGSITSVESQTLWKYLNRDKVISKFITEKCMNTAYQKMMYKYPSFIGEYYKNSILYVTSAQDVLIAYINNLLIPIEINYLDKIYMFTAGKPLLKMFVRAAQDHRYIIELDLGCKAEFKIKFSNGSVLQPQIVKVRGYKDIEDESPEFLENYIKNLKEICGDDVENNFVGKSELNFVSK